MIYFDGGKWWVLTNCCVQVGSRVCIPGLWMLQDRGVKQAGHRAAAFLVSVLVRSRFLSWVHNKLRISWIFYELNVKFVIFFRILVAVLTVFERLMDNFVSWYSFFLSFCYTCFSVLWFCMIILVSFLLGYLCMEKQSWLFSSTYGVRKQR